LAWIRTGTVAVNNGSATVVGTGTNWRAQDLIGQGFDGPDGRTYEIIDVPANGQMTLATPYLGATATGQPYQIQPFRGAVGDLLAATNSLLGSFAVVRDGIGAGLFPDGSAATPAFRFVNDQDTGIYRAGSNVLGIATGGVGRVIIDGNGNLGIGNASLGANAKLAVMSSDVYAATFNTTSVTASSTAISIGGYLNAGGGTGGTGAIRVYHNHAATAVSDMAFELSGGTEVMRIKGTGNVGIGTTVPASRLSVAVPGGVTALSLTGDFAGGNTVTINPYVTGVSNDGFEIRVGSNRRLSIDPSGHILPGSDAAQNLASASLRINNSYFAASPTVTSDEREKHWRGELNAAELRAAKRIIGELGIYQWNDAVAEKGEDGARLHFGVRAQRAFAILEDEGLDWQRYAWCCYDQWEEQTEPVMAEVTVTKTRKVMRPSTLLDPATGQPAMVEVDEAYEETEMQPTGETRVTLEAGDRHGVRPDQLHSWMIAVLAKTQAEQEVMIVSQAAAISSLEGRIASLEAA
jgi:hypothetical protein